MIASPQRDQGGVTSWPAGWRALPTVLGREELARLTAPIRPPVAVTGVTGFIGSHLCEALLAAGLEARGLVRDRTRLLPSLAADLELVDGGLESNDSVARLVAGAGTVFHLAGVVRSGSPARFDLANRVGTERVAEAVARLAPQAVLVHVSSLAAAGPAPTPEGLAPEDPARPVSAYGRSKLAAETAVQRLAPDWVIVRPPGVYGPRDVDVLQFFKLAARGLVPLPTGERWVTMAHVSDVVRALLAAAGRIGPRLLHVGEPRPRRIDDLVAELAAVGDVRARMVRVPAALLRVAGLGGSLLQRLGFSHVALTADKVRELLARHWAARTEPSLRALGLDGSVPFAVGAEATWRWYRDSGWLPRAKIAGA